MPRLIIKPLKRRLTEAQRREVEISLLTVKEAAKHYGLNIGLVYTIVNNRKKIKIKI